MFLLTICWFVAFVLFWHGGGWQDFLAAVFVAVGILVAGIPIRWTPKPPGLHWPNEED